MHIQMLCPCVYALCARLATHHASNSCSLQFPNFNQQIAEKLFRWARIRCRRAHTFKQSDHLYLHTLLAFLIKLLVQHHNPVSNKCPLCRWSCTGGHHVRPALMTCRGWVDYPSLIWPAQSGPIGQAMLGPASSMQPGLSFVAASTLKSRYMLA